MQVVESAARQKWCLTRDAFDGFLASLGPDRDTAADRYLRLRRDLVRLFEWRGCSTPDEYADETINRCARKIAEGQQIRDIASYSIGVARMLAREMAREPARKALPLEERSDLHVPPAESPSELEMREECLRHCLSQLSPEDRNFILDYYKDDRGKRIKTRKELTNLLGIPAGTLRMRALRLREKLQVSAEQWFQQRVEMGY
jgi:DNA-directed RNA polymerase specialized sigma24 family protein